MGNVRAIAPHLLRELLDYDPDTGVLTWKERGAEWFNAADRCAAWNTRWAGVEAFTSSAHGGKYRSGRILDKKFYAHRVVWAWHYGAWPTGTIDHINHDTTDNRILNLRDVTHNTNSKNQTQSKRNTSGTTGVHWVESRGKWVAQIVAEGRCIFLGRYTTLKEAAQVRKNAEIRYGFHENHGKNAAVPQKEGE